LQLAGAQMTFEPTKPAHCSVAVPSHALAEQGSPGAAPGHAGRPYAAGSPENGTHDPGPPGSAQVSHWPAQGPSQQTWSTQKPEEHSSGAAHFTPWAFFGTQVPAVHQASLAQLALGGHEMAHAPRLQMNVWQSVAVATHWPAKSH
jgi:hypothetical protein